MEFRYLVPICDGENVYIKSIDAKNREQAEDLFIKQWTEEIEDLDYPADIEDLKQSLEDYDITFGDFYEINDFIQ